MATTRRTLLGATLGASAAGLLGLAGCSTSAQPSGGTSAGAAGGSAAANAPTNMRFVWWGNAVRNKATGEVIEAYKKVKPNVSIQGEPGEWGSYWDKLATMTAANDMPDIVQMDMAYVREYGARGALLDVSKVDMSKFARGTADAAKLPKGVFGVNAGVNAMTYLANPAVLQKAGVSMPSDSWTWDKYAEVLLQVSKAVPGTWGAANPLNSNNAELWLRQSGKGFYAENGLGFEAGDIAPFFAYCLKLQEDGAVPPASLTVEDASKPVEQMLFGTGKAAFTLNWSNQVTVLDKATGQDVVMLRPPSKAGDPAKAQLFYKASMLWSVSARSRNQQAALDFIGWLVNDPAAVGTLLAERGAPANTERRAQIEGNLNASDKKSFAYLAKIEKEVGDPLIAPLVGSSAVSKAFERYSNDVLFKKETPEAAAKKLVDEAKSLIKV